MSKNLYKRYTIPLMRVCIILYGLQLMLYGDQSTVSKMEVKTISTIKITKDNNLTQKNMLPSEMFVVYIVWSRTNAIEFPSNP